jgi:alpha-glucosidase (family GH31 glycosyl hydrolase)
MEPAAHVNGVHAEWKLEKRALDLERSTGNANTGLRYFTRTFAEMVGKPLLIPRDWLGYLASGMGLGESVSGDVDRHPFQAYRYAIQDEPQAQKLLENWPEMCKENDIPCSGMHLSSGYTVGEEDGNRYVFTMNK